MTTIPMKNYKSVDWLLNCKTNFTFMNLFKHNKLTIPKYRKLENWKQKNDKAYSMLI